MRRPRNDDLSSFDLVLDIMCNAFGGMIFIALMLTIISQTIAIHEPEDVENRWREIHSKSPESQEKETSDNPLDRHGGHGAFQKGDERRRQLMEQIKRLKDDNLKLDITLHQLKQETDALLRKIDDLKQKSERELRYPRLHAIDKQPVFIALRYNKLYPISNLSAPYGNSRHRGYDLSHLKRWEEGDRTMIDPIAGRGEQVFDVTENMIQAGRRRGRLIDDRFNTINPEKEYLSFAVYPDAFEAFLALKSFCIEQQFDYNWFIVKEGLSIVRGQGHQRMHHAQ